MKQRLAAILALAVAGCSEAEPPALRPAPPPRVVPAPSAPAPAPAAPEAAPPVATPLRPAPPAPIPLAAPAPPPDAGRPGRPAAELTSPTFTLETLSGSAEVFLNGERVGTTPYRWWVSPQTEFAAGILVEEWPPPGTRLAAQGRFLTDAGVWTSMEVRISDVASPDSVLYVRADLAGRRVQGALRLRIPGHRFTPYMPSQVTEDSADFQRWSRALWFDRD